MNSDNINQTDQPIEPIREFGIKRENEERRDGGCAVVFDPAKQKYAVGKQDNNGAYRLFSGGVDEKEDIQTGIMREVLEESGLYSFSHIEKVAEAFTHFHNTLKNVNRVAKATCLLAVLESADLKPVKLEEHEKFSLIWVTEEEMLANWNAGNQEHDYDHWFYFMEKAVAKLKELGYVR